MTDNESNAAAGTEEAMISVSPKLWAKYIEERDAALAERDRLQAEVLRVTGERDAARRAARWLASHAPGTPVPDYVSAGVDALPPAPTADGEVGK